MDVRRQRARRCPYYGTGLDDVTTDLSNVECMVTCFAFTLGDDTLYGNEAEYETYCEGATRTAG